MMWLDQAKIANDPLPIINAYDRRFLFLSQPHSGARMSRESEDPAMHAYHLGRLVIRNSNPPVDEQVALVIFDGTPTDDTCLDLAVSHMGVDIGCADFVRWDELGAHPKGGENPIRISLPEGNDFIYYLVPALAA